MYKTFLLILSFCFSFLSVSAKAANSYAINLEWFNNFNDELLVQYIVEGLNYNKDVRIAKNNILKSRQEKNLKISDEFFNVDVGANYLLLKIPKTAIPFNDIQTNSFALPFVVMWEIDYLGKNYNKIQKARFDIENSCFDLKSANLLVATEIASSYFNISSLNKQIEYKEMMVDMLDKIYKRRKKMYDFGVISSIEINLAEDLYLSERNSLNKLLKEKIAFLTQLAQLMGRSPYEIDDIRVNQFDNITYKGIYPENLNGSIILNRPDIMKLENEIKKAKIDITIAKKDFLPKLNVAGVLVFSTVVQNFGWKGALAGLLAGATQNIFDGGKRIFTLKKTKREYDIALENYLKYDLMALKEVNDALYNLKYDYEIYLGEEKRANLENSNFIKIYNSYNKGAKSYIDYANENIQNLKSKNNLVSSKNQNFINLITLYKAVGGAL